MKERERVRENVCTMRMSKEEREWAKKQERDRMGKEKKRVIKKRE